MLLFRHLAILMLFSLGVFNARADVWETQRPWDSRDEDSFSQWIRKMPMDVFTAETSPYKGISTDCADAAYLLRTIFAYEHGLPIAFSDVQLTNKNKSFDGIEAGLPRLKKFLTLVRNQVNTRSLVNDTYPLAINRITIRAGVLFVHPQSGNDVPLTYRSGHVFYVQRIFENGMIRYFSSTVPAMVRELQPRIDISFAPFTKEGGYRAWKTPGSPLRTGERQGDRLIDRPGESEEQFELAHWRKNAYRDPDLWEAWSKAIRQRLALRAATPDEELGANIENIRGYVKERARLVNRAWSIYQSKYHGEQCMNAGDYDDYSTPTRDVKIQTELDTLRTAALRYLQAKGRVADQRGLAQLYSQYRFEVLPGVSIDLNQMWTTFETKVVLSISEPEHSPQVRWGLEAQDRWPCPHRAKQYVGGELVNQ